MKHPDREEWVPFVFGEADAEVRKRLGQHLHECPECAREVAGWRRSLRKLDRWPLPAPAEPCAVPFAPVLKWALAAALVLGAGLLIGRFTAPTPVNAAELRAEVESSVRSSLQREMQVALGQMRTQTAEAVAAAEARLVKASASDTQRVWQGLLDVLSNTRAEDARSVQALLQRVQERHDAQFVALRKDLETLASTADEQLQQARLGLVQLAAAHKNPMD